ncbi:MAG TPA: hypothetical protein VKU87_08790, partial [Thermomicrobiaceae bacterium]|nr:hypothetical protein [Thermomicrobiaceae bacterium]
SIWWGEEAPADPWDARTLEWSIASPPPVYNFAVEPTVHSRDAWWEYKRDVVAGKVDPQDKPAPPTFVHMPAPSYYPVLAAIFLTGVAASMVFVFWPTVFLSGFLFIASIYAWAFESNNGEPARTVPEPIYRIPAEAAGGAAGD